MRDVRCVTLLEGMQSTTEQFRSSKTLVVQETETLTAWGWICGRPLQELSEIWPILKIVCSFVISTLFPLRLASEPCDSEDEPSDCLDSASSFFKQAISFFRLCILVNFLSFELSKAGSRKYIAGSLTKITYPARNPTGFQLYPKHNKRRYSNPIVYTKPRNSDKRINHELNAFPGKFVSRVHRKGIRSRSLHEEYFTAEEFQGKLSFSEFVQAVPSNPCGGLTIIQNTPIERLKHRNKKNKWNPRIKAEFCSF